jgi:hypothetical protein
MSVEADRPRRVRVTREIALRRLAGCARPAPQQIVVYPAGWVGLMPRHHIARAGDAIEEAR